jgi:hypothetical protein
MFICYPGYQPKVGFLQKQIKRLPMLYDEEYFKTHPSTRPADHVNDDGSSTSVLEELPMP